MYKNEELLKKRKENDYSDMFEPKHNSFEKEEDVSIVWEVLAVTVLMVVLVGAYLIATN